MGTDGGGGHVPWTHRMELKTSARLANERPPSPEGRHISLASVRLGRNGFVFIIPICWFPLTPLLRSSTSTAHPNLNKLAWGWRRHRPPAPSCISFCAILIILAGLQPLTVRAASFAAGLRWSKGKTAPLIHLPRHGRYVPSAVVLRYYCTTA